MARSFSDGSAIRYVLPVLWMTLFFTWWSEYAIIKDDAYAYAKWRHLGRSLPSLVSNLYACWFYAYTNYRLIVFQSAICATMIPSVRPSVTLVISVNRLIHCQTFSPPADVSILACCLVSCVSFRRPIVSCRMLSVGWKWQVVKHAESESRTLSRGHESQQADARSRPHWNECAQQLAT